MAQQNQNIPLRHPPPQATPVVPLGGGNVPLASLMTPGTNQWQLANQVDQLIAAQFDNKKGLQDIADGLQASLAGIGNQLQDKFNTVDTGLQGVSDHMGQVRDRLKNLEDEANSNSTAVRKLGTDQIHFQDELVQTNNRLRTLMNKVLDANGDPANIRVTGPYALDPNDPRTIPRVPPNTMVFKGGQGSDFLRFLSGFKNLVSMQKYPEDYAKQALRHCMQDKAADTVDKLDHVNQTLEQLYDQYEISFLPPSLSEASKLLFEETKQQSKETVIDYANRLEHNWVRGFPEDYKDARYAALIRHFVKGLQRQRIREAVLRARPKTLLEAKQAALDESAIVDLSKIDIKAAEAMEVGHLDINKLEPKDAQCYECREYGHFARSCPNGKGSSDNNTNFIRYKNRNRSGSGGRRDRRRSSSRDRGRGRSSSRDRSINHVKGGKASRSSSRDGKGSRRSGSNDGRGSRSSSKSKSGKINQMNKKKRYFKLSKKGVKKYGRKRIQEMTNDQISEILEEDEKNGDQTEYEDFVVEDDDDRENF